MCLLACEWTMASSATASKIFFSDEKVCRDLLDAARDGKLDEVIRLLPLAQEKGVVNKVMHGVNTHTYRTEKRAREGRMNYSACHNAHVHLILFHVCMREAD